MMSMSSPLKKQPEAVADRVLKRAEISKMARRLQNRLALAQFKTKHGLEDLTLDKIEPRFEDKIRRSQMPLPDGDILSDSSSSASDLPYPSRTLMSSPLKAPLFSDAIGSSSGSTGHRKRSYPDPFDHNMSSPSKRFRQSPTAHRSFSHPTWKDSHNLLAQSSPLKLGRQQHFTTSVGPDLSFFSGSRQIRDIYASTNYAATSDDDDDLPTHSFHHTSHHHSIRISPPRTPPMRSRSLLKKNRGSRTITKNDSNNSSSSNNNNNNNNSNNNNSTNNKTNGEEGADLLLYLAASPSPANPPRSNNRMEPPSTPPPKRNLALPSSMMTTPGGGNPFPATPGLNGFNFEDFVHMTPSPAQKPWKTPGTLGGSRTPATVARRRLTFDDTTTS
ncbi:hypothetical protein QBC42DRAFT_50389 [Cladorrhinum samala]|uniref:Uncharacterized protein n=1 Tax=Cladorrhinum samala TaxID=585594 RepID=A0AAV9HVR3_9PEZI|nr:hypothetical protein QBC42DRAFT_50389 [Cladorrhinum samala]